MILLNIIVAFLLIILSPVILLNWLLTGGERLGFWGELPSEVVWIHSASVGEASVAAVLRDMTARLLPDTPVLFTAATEAGAGRLKQIARPGDAVRLLVIDHPIFIHNAIKRTKIRAFLLVETELWGNLLALLGKKRVPIIICNGRFSRKSIALLRYFPPLRSIVKKMVSAFLVRYPVDAEALSAVGINDDKVLVMGSLKSAMRIEPPSITNPFDGRPTIVAGSTRPGEERMLLNALKMVRAQIPNAAMIIAPRHPERFDDVANMLEQDGFRYGRLSNMSAFDGDILLVDELGKLASLYSLGNIAFVGGTLTNFGGHNPLEPAFWGKPVMFGEYYNSDRENYENLLINGGGRVVRNTNELAKTIMELLSDNKLREKMGASAKATVEKLSEVEERYRKELAKWLL